jgi:carboxylesterase type B
MDGNIGAWDSLAAVEWTKEHIGKFGGDPNRITVIGQSAGAGIITSLLLGQEGNLKLPFDHAWISSPALPPRRNIERSRPVFDQILNTTKCSDVDCMRQLPESAIKAANTYMFVDLVPGSGGGSLGPGVGFSPTVDGDLLTDLPASAFSNGKFNKNLKQLVVGNTANEVNCNHYYTRYHTY